MFCPQAMSTELVGGFKVSTHLKKYARENWIIFPNFAGWNNFPKFSGWDIKKSLKPPPRKRTPRLGGRHQQAQRCTIIEAGSITCRSGVGGVGGCGCPLPVRFPDWEDGPKLANPKLYETELGRKNRFPRWKQHRKRGPATHLNKKFIQNTCPWHLVRSSHCSSTKSDSFGMIRRLPRSKCVGTTTHNI